MMRLGLRLLPLAICSCLWGGGGVGSGLAPAQDTEIVAFAEHVDGFYLSLEGRAVDTLATYEDERLRGYFAGPREFSDYYASLAAQLRGADFRHARPNATRVREFWFDGPDLAQVEVLIEGSHRRALRFWGIRVVRVDTWRYDGNSWVLSPDQL
ncbi:MAG: hypothetical protein HRU00_11560 [Myxococcales bacterium]|nr:hypothetical protein [Myxococcales bacterium]